MDHLENRTLLTIITEAAVEHALLKDLEKLGIKGYTVSDVRGRGSRGVRDATWGEAANIRVEVICQRELALKALQFIQEKFYQNYAMISFLQDVEVLRPEKF
jgi:nitrogen regulatory protein PII